MASLAVDYIDDANQPVAFHGTVTQAGVEDNEGGTSSMRLLVEGPFGPFAAGTRARSIGSSLPRRSWAKLLAGRKITTEARYHGAVFDREFEFVLQHEEYDSDFLVRFLAGIGASFLVTADSEATVLPFIEDVQDFSDQVVPCPIGPSSPRKPRRWQMTHLEFARRVAPDKVVMTAYDPKRPRLAIEATGKEGESKNRLYSPLGRFDGQSWPFGIVGRHHDLVRRHAPSSPRWVTATFEVSSEKTGR